MMIGWQSCASEDLIRRIGDAHTAFPSGFTPHPKLAQLCERRRDMAYGTRPIDWGFAELLACPVKTSAARPSFSVTRSYTTTSTEESSLPSSSSPPTRRVSTSMTLPSPNTRSSPSTTATQWSAPMP